MTRKHFVALADALRAVRPQPSKLAGGQYYAGQKQTWSEARTEIARALRQVAPNFNYDRFLDHTEKD